MPVEVLKPSLSAFDLGYLARESMKCLDDNPFAQGTKMACEWFLGYDIGDTEMAEA